MHQVTKKKIFRFILFLAAICAGITGGLYFASRGNYTTQLGVQKVLSDRGTFLTRKMSRPDGMHPFAFQAFIRACKSTDIHPFRIGQTFGDHPNSAGYHLQDEMMTVEGERVPFSAAVDIGTCDLSPQLINRFVHELRVERFAAFYRSGPKWKEKEHIHAVYAFLPMKWQLKGQVREYLRDHNPPWEREWRRSRFSG